MTATRRAMHGHPAYGPTGRCPEELAFYVGMHHPGRARHVELGFISVNRLRERRSAFTPPTGGWVMDSGAFTEIATHGRYRYGVAEYAQQIQRWHGVGGLHAAVAQDWMCDPGILAKTGLTVAEHQRRTTARYDALAKLAPSDVYVMPVLQGYEPVQYVDHLHAYGEWLPAGAWVGVGSIAKRNAQPGAVYAILSAIADERPDLRLHGFGLKTTALTSTPIRALLSSADSMAWSFAARRNGRNPNDWREAQRFAKDITRRPPQLSLL